MKNVLGKFLLLAVLLFAALPSWGQKRIYTKGYKIQDFKSKTTKVVLGGRPSMDAAIRQEVTSLWTISPYEFCTQAQYEKQKTSPDNYFLHVEAVKGFIYLTLSKGGKNEDKDALNKPFTIVSVPIAGDRDKSGRECIFMPAYISMIQDYTEAAMDSESVAYSGIRAIRKHRPGGTTVISDPDEAARAFQERRSGTAVQVIITPTGDPSEKPRVKYTFGTEDYRLYAFSRL